MDELQAIAKNPPTRVNAKGRTVLDPAGRRAAVINIINTFMADSKSLFEHAGATLGVLARQKLFNAYLGGNTSATAAQGGGGSTSLPVKSCAGFYRTNNAAGQEVAVGVSNPIAITIGASTSASGRCTGRYRHGSTHRRVMAARSACSSAGVSCV